MVITRRKFYLMDLHPSPSPRFQSGVSLVCSENWSGLVENCERSRWADKQNKLHYNIGAGALNSETCLLTTIYGCRLVFGHNV